MSTASIIAIPYYDDATTWVGRMAYTDGYPQFLARALHEIVQRDGVETARRILTHEHYSWSRILPTPLDSSAELGPDYVNGYGKVDDVQSHVADWRRHDDKNGGVEWVYVLADDELVVYTAEPNPIAPGGFAWKRVGSLPYADEVDDESVTKMQCGENYERCKHLAAAHFPEEVPTSSTISARDYLSGNFTNI